ncbi:MAG: Hint domain-containing protein [Pseudomonadota bacterium]
MPTSYTDQFFTFDPANPPPVGTSVSFSSLVMVDQDDDGDIDPAGGDTVNGLDVQNAWPGDTVTINVPGVGNVTYTGITFYTASGGRFFTPTDGQVLQNGTFQGATFVNTQAPLDVDDLGPPCFVSGTLIETAQGAVAVEAIAPGDRILTRDNGLQPVQWVGARVIAGSGKTAPVRIAAGVLGNNRALVVSPQHRVLITAWRADLLFGTAEVLVAAKHLVNGDTIRRAPTRAVRYHHLLFETHELVLSEGCWTESYLPSGAVAARDRAVQSELLALFPQLAPGRTQDVPAAQRAVRPIVKAYEARVLLQ